MATGRSWREVEADLAEVCGSLNALHGRLVEIVADALATGAWQGPGYRSVEHWLTVQCGVSTATAVRIARIARRRAEFPICIEGLEAGELSLDQVATATRAPAHTDATMADYARAMTVPQLDRVVRRYPFEDGDGTAPQRAARVVIARHDDGTFELRASRLAADQGRVVERALTEARDALFRDGNPAVTWVDALIEVCARSLDTTPERARRERYRINLHLDTRTGCATWGDGWSLPDAIRRHLTCDGLLSPVLFDGSTPVGVGRSQRVVPERTRRLVIWRDGGCRVPGCHHDRWVEVHHVVHWEDLGPTETWNLASLCPAHHRAHHQGEFTVTGNADDPDGLTFVDARGRPMALSPPPPPDGPPRPPARPFRHPTGERLDPRWIAFPDPPRAA